MRTWLLKLILGKKDWLVISHALGQSVDSWWEVSRDEALLTSDSEDDRNCATDCYEWAVAGERMMYNLFGWRKNVR